MPLVGNTYKIESGKPARRILDRRPGRKGAAIQKLSNPGDLWFRWGDRASVDTGFVLSGRAYYDTTQRSPEEDLWVATQGTGDMTVYIEEWW